MKTNLIDSPATLADAAQHDSRPIDPKNPRNLWTDKPRPVAILDKQQTLALVANPGDFMENRDHWAIKSQYLCDFMDEMEKAGYVYNLQAQRAVESANGLPEGPENGSVLSILIYNAQGYRRGDRLVADGWQPGAELLTVGAKLIVCGSNFIGMPVQEVLTVRDVEGKLYAFRPKKRKYAVKVADMPCKLAA